MPPWACSLCGKTPVDPKNLQYEFCEYCQNYTDAAILQPDQFNYVRFVGGPHDNMHRYIELRLPHDGDEWAPVPGSPAVYRWESTQYVYVRG
jgi:hypothetical protein